MSAICDSHRNRFGTDRNLWVERPGSMSMPTADFENPCSWCVTEEKTPKRLDKEESMETQNSSSIFERIKRFFSN